MGARHARQDDAAWKLAIEIDERPQQTYDEEDCCHEVAWLVGIFVEPPPNANQLEIELKFCRGSRKMQRPLEEVDVAVLANEDRVLGLDRL
jgi:hypothetical protein